VIGHKPLRNQYLYRSASRLYDERRFQIFQVYVRFSRRLLTGFVTRTADEYVVAIQVSVVADISTGRLASGFLRT
jgi:hypothetical protein